MLFLFRLLPLIHTRACFMKVKKLPGEVAFMEKGIFFSSLKMVICIFGSVK